MSSLFSHLFLHARSLTPLSTTSDVGVASSCSSVMSAACQFELWFSNISILFIFFICRSCLQVLLGYIFISSYLKARVFVVCRQPIFNVFWTKSGGIFPSTDLHMILRAGLVCQFNFLKELVHHQHCCLKFYNHDLERE